MPDKASSEKLLYCSFCGKSQHEVRKLIAGPSVFICDECIDLCNDIIREEMQGDEATKLAKSNLPVPREICSVGMPDDRIFKAPPSEDRANFRSATPRGFARACFLANALEFKGKGY